MKPFMLAGIGLVLAASGWGTVYTLGSQLTRSGTANIAPSSTWVEPSMITPTRTGEVGRDAEAQFALGSEQDVVALRTGFVVLRHRIEQRAEPPKSLATHGGGHEERYRQAQRKSPPREDIDRRAQQRIELLEDTLRAEHADPDWSAQAAQGIAEALRKARALGIATSGVACRSTLCRVELAYANPQDFVEFQQIFLTQVSDLLPDALIEQKDGGDGRTNTVIYLARQAYELPALAEER